MQINKYALRILKTLFKILPILFWVLLIFGFDAPCIAFTTLISATIHELSHIAVTVFLIGGFSFRGSVSGFRLATKRQLSYKEELLIAAAGPMANFVVFLSTLPYLPSGKYLAQLGIISLFTGISNLLPIEGYDGYRIIECIAGQLGAKETFLRILRATSFAIISTMTFISLYFIKRLDGGYWIFFLFSTILVRTIKNNNKMDFTRKREKKRDFERF